MNTDVYKVWYYSPEAGMELTITIGGNTNAEDIRARFRLGRIIKIKKVKGVMLPSVVYAGPAGAK